MSRKPVAFPLSYLGLAQLQAEGHEDTGELRLSSLPER